MSFVAPSLSLRVGFICFMTSRLLCVTQNHANADGVAQHHIGIPLAVNSKPSSRAIGGGWRIISRQLKTSARYYPIGPLTFELINISSTEVLTAGRVGNDSTLLKNSAIGQHRFAGGGCSSPEECSINQKDTASLIYWDNPADIPDGYTHPVVKQGHSVPNIFNAISGHGSLANHVRMIIKSSKNAWISPIFL